jgi:hypothetical protein
MSKGYSKDDYARIIAGEAPLPNFEPMTADHFCNAIAAGGHGMTPVWGWSKGEHGHKAWAQYFLANFSNMGSEPDGSGYVCIYGMNKPTVGRFAICKHEKKLDAGANPSRGWNPGRCVKCGLDMTIDSGD